MARVAAIGKRSAVQGFGLVGALAYAADDEQAVRDAWAELPADVAIVVLTPAAKRALEEVPAATPDRIGGQHRQAPMTVVMAP